MPVYRTPDGRIVEERTDVTPPRAGRDPDPTVAKPEGSGTEPGDASRRWKTRYTETTVVRRPATETPDTETVRESAGGGDPPTRLVGAIRGGTVDSENILPVVGWLVVVDGPGVGRDLRIGVGRNALGRDGSNRIPLPFGDTHISRREHLWITYDPVNRLFSVAPGNSPNLAYLNGVAIEQRMPLADGCTIVVGQTTLRFAAFCGDGFTWPNAE